jgi:hypothetical protein
MYLNLAELDHVGVRICRRLSHDLVIEAGPDGRGATVTAAIR